MSVTAQYTNKSDHSYKHGSVAFSISRYPTFHSVLSFTDFNWYALKPKDDATYKKRVDQELLNGRLAMMAIGGIATQSVITGHGFPYV